MITTYEEWNFYRKMLFISMCYNTLLFSCTMMVFAQTEYFYFKDTVHTNSPKTFYGASKFILNASSLLAALAVSYYADSVRNIRKIYFSLTTCVVLVGYATYTLYYSPYLVLTSNFLTGVTAAQAVSAMAEMSRLYKKEDLTYRISILAISNTIGSIVGPALVFAFKKVHVHIGDWKIAMGNVSAIYIFVLTVFGLIYNLIFMCNLSRDYETLPISEKEKADIFLQHETFYANDENDKVSSSENKSLINSSEERKKRRKTIYASNIYSY